MQKKEFEMVVRGGASMALVNLAGLFQAVFTGCHSDVDHFIER